MALDRSSAHIFVKNGHFPQFYSENDPNNFAPKIVSKMLFWLSMNLLDFVVLLFFLLVVLFVFNHHVGFIFALHLVFLLLFLLFLLYYFVMFWFLETCHKNISEKWKLQKQQKWKMQKNTDILTRAVSTIVFTNSVFFLFLCFFIFCIFAENTINIGVSANPKNTFYKLKIGPSIS